MNQCSSGVARFHAAHGVAGRANPFSQILLRQVPAATCKRNRLPKAIEAAHDGHPTMKPVELVERAIKNSSKSRDIVLDLFGGSGTTLIASEKTGRQARLIELDPKFVDVIIKRWEDYTGQQAVRENDGVKFGELAISAAIAQGQDAPAVASA